MSLDVYLTTDTPRTKAPLVYVRENGGTVALTPEEWAQRHPNRAPVMVDEPETTTEVFSANITHNLNTMAEEAGIYRVCWRPEEIGITKAAQLVPLLLEGLKQLKADPAKFRQFDAANGWGTYDQFVPWVERYLEACEAYPDATVDVWR